MPRIDGRSITTLDAYGAATPLIDEPRVDRAEATNKVFITETAVYARVQRKQLQVGKHMPPGAAFQILYAPTTTKSNTEGRDRSI